MDAENWSEGQKIGEAARARREQQTATSVATVHRVVHAVIEHTQPVEQAPGNTHVV
jgi:hypothetical protein